MKLSTELDHKEAKFSHVTFFAGATLKPIVGPIPHHGHIKCTLHSDTQGSAQWYFTVTFLQHSARLMLDIVQWTMTPGAQGYTGCRNLQACLGTSNI